MKKGNEGRRQWLKALIANELAVEVLKAGIDKSRPNGFGQDSFPSGHTARAFMGAAFIHQRYDWKYAIPGYLGAAWVGYLRVDENKHVTEDVLAGALVGIGASFLFTTPYNNFEITPVATANYYGIAIRGRW